MFFVCVFQMILKTLCSFLAMVLELLGVYGDGEFKGYYGYPYIAFIINCSQMWALYCLVKFYHVTRERLQPIRPLAKFISFKAIVFATWWQGVGIALLCYLEVLPNKGRFQTELQDFLICVEMAIAAVAHIFVFSAKTVPHFLPVSEYGNISTNTIKEVVKVEEGDEEKPAVIEKNRNKGRGSRKQV
ncbi:putative organic solute transporter subunit alpha/Transmembrane protein [Helianthus annuus]|nr:putative organic solute transporter subunit alpha/Transmembrane protein [Helianthus annuus]